MAYSDNAIELRKCLEEGCGNWALWAAPDQKCRWHTTWAWAKGKSDVPVCRCAAYAWPHRPGGGLCEWPEKPTKTSDVPLGKRGKPKKRKKWVIVEEWSYDAERDPIEKLYEFVETMEAKQNADD